MLRDQSVLHRLAVIGPFEDELSVPIRIAGGLIWENIDTKRVDPAEHGIELLTSATCTDSSESAVNAVLAEAQYLAAKAINEIKMAQPGLAPLIQTLVCTFNPETQLVTRHSFVADAAML